MAKTILLIEDDQTILKMYSKKFTNEGYEVLAASDGDEAFKFLAAAKQKPAVVLSDIMLPKQNGFDILEKLKADPSTKDIPVILLTNLGGGEQDRERGKSLGAVDYLVKSEMTPAEIVEKVEGIVKE